MPSSSPRRLDLSHFAFYRGYLDGLPLSVLKTRYLPLGLDMRQAKTAIQWIRDTLSAAARRVGDFEAARLLRLTPSHLPLGSTPCPTLEDYRESHDPEGFYSEEELIAQYQAEFAGVQDRRVRRNARLRQRQANALKRMEDCLAEDPGSDHAISGWFEATLAKRLNEANLVKLSDLLTFIDRFGHRWWRHIPRLGPKTAHRIVQWIGVHETSLHYQLSPLAITPRRALSIDHPVLTRSPQSTIAPLEALCVPHALDGSLGTNRALVSRNQLEVHSDYAAIQCWLAVHQNTPHTYRAYRTQAERLLLWAIFAKHKPLSSLTTTDCNTYITTFLKNPEPAEVWIGSRSTERFRPNWRPFDGPLSDRSRETARRILKVMCEWLVRQRYLESNPFDGLKSLPIAQSIDADGRSLTQAQWQFVLQTVTRIRYTPTELRDYFALLFAYATGLRLSELASATTDQLTRKTLDSVLDNAWMLNVIGKRGKLRQVPMPRALMDILMDYFQQRGLPLSPEACSKGTPLIAKLTHAETGLTCSGLALLYQRLFKRAADHLHIEHPHAAQELRTVTTHWLRHTHSSHAVAAGTPLEIIRENLGHASLNTTTIYVKASKERRYQTMDSFLNQVLRDPA